MIFAISSFQRKVFGSNGIGGRGVVGKKFPLAHLLRPQNFPLHFFQKLT